MESASSNNKRQKLLEDSKEEEWFSCVICSESWKSRGEHCAVSLKCGHMFGKKCINRWLTSSASKQEQKKATCPTCMKVARLNDIRNVIPSRISVRDTTELDLLKQELDGLQTKIYESEKQLDLSYLSLNLHKKQLKRAKENLVLKSLSPKEPPATPPNTNIPDTAEGKEQHLAKVDSNKETKEEETAEVTAKATVPQLQRFAICSSVRLSESLNAARIMTFDKSHGSAYISIKTDTTSEHSILTLDIETNTITTSPSVHNKAVRDIKYQESSGLIMTISIDSTLRFTSAKSNVVEQTIQLPLSGWSCLFDEADPNKIYCGLSDSSVLIYDRRYTNNFMQKLHNPVLQKTPLHSMFFKTVNNKPSIFCSNLMEMFAWSTSPDIPNCKVLDIQDQKDYKPYAVSSSEGSENYILLSSRNKTSTRHQVIDVNQHDTPTVVSSYDAAFSQKSLVRNCSFMMLDSEDPVVCYGDEPKGSLHLVRSNNEIQRFQIQNCPLDIQLYSPERLSFLTGNRYFMLKPIFSD